MSHVTRHKGTIDKERRTGAPNTRLIPLSLSPISFPQVAL